MANPWDKITETERQAAQERIDAASDEAFALAMDVLHDHALEQALWRRLERRQSGTDTGTDTKSGNTSL